MSHDNDVIVLRGRSPGSAASPPPLSVACAWLSSSASSSKRGARVLARQPEPLGDALGEQPVGARAS
jgi:hypothetical protein